MSTVALLLVKNEVDIIAVTVRHLLAHVDAVFVLDNLSTDGTHDVLREIQAEDDRLEMWLDHEPGHYQGRKMTGMAMSALERGHRWALCCDADEIWLAPDGRPIRDWLDGLGRETQMVKAAIYNHVVTALDDPDDPNPVTRIRWRQRTPHDKKWSKVAVRLRPDLTIMDGNHDARTRGTGTVVHGLELRHFPYRSPEQFVSKAVTGYAALRATDLDEGTGAHWRTYGQAIEEGGEEAGHAWFYDAFYSTDPHADDSLEENPAPVAVSAEPVAIEGFGDVLGPGFVMP